MNIPANDIVEFDAAGVGRVTYTPKPGVPEDGESCMSDSFGVAVIISRREMVDRPSRRSVRNGIKVLVDIEGLGIAARTDVGVDWHGGRRVERQNDYDVDRQWRS